MSEIVEIKVRIDASKKDRYDTHCETLKVSRNVRLNELIDADLDGKIASQRVLSEPPKKVSEAELIRANHERFLGELEALFAKNRTAMSQHLAPLKSVASVALTEKRFNTVDDANAKLMAELSGLRQSVMDSAQSSAAAIAKVQAGLKIERPDFVQDPRTGGGFAAGVLGVFLLIALLPGSCAPARGVAKLAMGEGDPVEAAARLAGQGNKAIEATVFSSVRLSKDDGFLASYRACIEAANRSTKRTTCQLSMPALTQP